MCIFLWNIHIVNTKIETGPTSGSDADLRDSVLMVALGQMNTILDAYFQQSILGIVIIISVALTFDRSKTAVVK